MGVMPRNCENYLLEHHLIFEPKSENLRLQKAVGRP